MNRRGAGSLAVAGVSPLAKESQSGVNRRGACGEKHFHINALDAQSFTSFMGDRGGEGMRNTWSTRCWFQER